MKTKGVKDDTYVWTESMPNWFFAKSVRELSTILTGESKSQPYFSGTQQIPPQLPNTPPTSYRQNQGQPPKTYLLETILTTILTAIFCYCPLGIPSVIYASRVEKKFYAGDIFGAEQDSANAKKWMLINVGVCIGLGVLYFLILGFAMFSGIGVDDFK